MCVHVYVCGGGGEGEGEGERMSGTLVSKETQEEKEEETCPGMPPGGHGQSVSK